MPVAVLITEPNQPAQLLPWGRRFAAASKTELLVIVPRRATGKKVWREVSLKGEGSTVEAAIRQVSDQLGLSLANEHTSADADRSVAIRVRELSAPDIGSVLVEEFDELHISRLIIPASSAAKADQQGDDWQRRLFQNTPCETMYLRDDAHQDSAQVKILVVVTGKSEDSQAIKTATELARTGNGIITAIYVGPHVDEVSPAVGRRILNRVVMGALDSETAGVNQDVVLADSLVAGLQQYGLEGFDLILFGSRWQRDARRLLDSNLFPGTAPDTLPAICVVRSAIPLPARVLRRVERLAERAVPQLGREQRISLVERIQSSSKWDFDFIALICLATLIAGLGLIDNSPAVIIGAMLVAPLMTPIMGTGLGLAQGNGRLIRDTLRTIASAFVLSFIIGVFLLGPFSAHELTPEMESRGEPKTLHLIVGLVSGVAAAYATGRPNLLSALPGVAIAAALVPPLATSGIATFRFRWDTARGALGLFGANMLAIIVGTALTFWLVGIRPTKKNQQSQSWPTWLFGALILVTAGLAAWMSIDVGRSPR